MRYWVSLAITRRKPLLNTSHSRPPLPPPDSGKSFAERAVTLYSSFKFAFGLHHKVTGPPKLPPDLERRIFKSCALECPEICTVLVLVAKRVHVW